MRGYVHQTDAQNITLTSETPIHETLEKIIGGATGQETNINSVQLFYVRQTNGELEGKKNVYYFEPEFSYLVDIGKPRLALVEVLYQVPTVKEGFDYRTIGRGDGEFPQLNEAVVYSAQGNTAQDILYPTAVGELIIGAKPDVSEDKLREALSNYVTEITSNGAYYLAKVDPFDELAKADQIMDEVKEVRYASLNKKIRSTAGPWWIDRVL